MPVQTYEKTLQRLIQIAKDKARRRDWGEEAFQINTKILEIQPQHIGTLTRLAKCFLENENDEAALKIYEQVCSLQPDNAIARNGKIRLYRRIEEKNRVILQGVQCSEAESSDDLSKASDWKSFIPSIDYATIHENRYSPKIKTVNRPCQQDTDFVPHRLKEEFWTNKISDSTDYYELRAIGESARYTQEYALAIRAYEKAHSLFPNPSVKIRMASTLRRMHRLTDAQKLYEVVLSAEENNTFAKIGLASVLNDMGERESAKQLYLTVLEADEFNSYALNGLAAVYIKFGELRLSEECLRKVESTEDSPDVSVLKMLRDEYYKKQDTKKINDIQRWIDTVKRAQKTGEKFDFSKEF